MNFWKSIDGATLFDPSYLIDKTIRTRSELNRAEARNILRAIEKYLATRPSPRKAPFHLPWMLKLHHEMFGDVWENAGEIRKEDLNIGVAWHQVEVQLFELQQDLECWQSNRIDIVEQSARLHHRAVFIHPFHDGNGRWARLLANILLMRSGKSIIRWPESGMLSETEIRSEYLSAIRQADSGDLQPLFELHHTYQGGQS